MFGKVFYTLFIVMLTANIGVGIIAPLLSTYAKSFEATGVWIGVVFSGFAISRIIFSPLMGRISDRHSRKIFISTGLLLYTMVSFGYVFANSVYALTAVRLLQGFASAVITPIVISYIGEISPRKHEGTFVGTFNAAFFIGEGLGPLIGGTLNDLAGLHSAFYAMGGLSAFALILLLFLVPDRKSRFKKRKLISFRKIFHDNVVRAIVSFRFSDAFTRGLTFAFLPLYAVTINVTALEIGIVLSVAHLIVGLLQPPFGKISDKIGSDKLLVLGNSATAILFFLLAFSRNFLDLLVFGILIGVAGAMTKISAVTLAVVRGRKIGMGSMMGIFSSSRDSGMIVAPILAGAVMDVSGVQSVFWLGGVMAIIGIIMFYFFLSRNKKLT